MMRRNRLPELRRRFTGFAVEGLRVLSTKIEVLGKPWIARNGTESRGMDA